MYKLNVDILRLFSYYNLIFVSNKLERSKIKYRVDVILSELERSRSKSNYLGKETGMGSLDFGKTLGPEKLRKIIDFNNNVLVVSSGTKLDING